MIVAGIDAGSRAIKVVLMDGDDRRVLATAMGDQGVRQDELAMSVLASALEQSGRSRGDLGAVVATGYGRDMLQIATETVTEITCHAHGVHHHHPDCRTIIDIGGQDSKLIRLRDDGHVRDFVMNDRCAAGTGRFLEVVAERLKLDLGDLGKVAAEADAPAAISSMCVVFAETEITGLLAAGASPSNIVAGVQASIASRVATMGGRNITEPVVFTGGVALVTGMQAAMETALKRPVCVAKDPRFTGALGAALLAAEG